MSGWEELSTAGAGLKAWQAGGEASAATCETCDPTFLPLAGLRVWVCGGRDVRCEDSQQGTCSRGEPHWVDRSPDPIIGIVSHLDSKGSSGCETQAGT